MTAWLTLQVSPAGTPVFAEGCGNYRAKSRLGCFHESGGHDFVAAALQNHFWQRLCRRAVEHFARGCRKNSAVARAREDVLLWAVKYGAGVVRAQATEREVGVLGRAQQKTRTVILRIRENGRAAHRNFSYVRHNFYRIRSFSLPQVNRKNAERSERAAEAQPASKSAAGEGRFFRRQLFGEIQRGRFFIRFCLCSSAFNCGDFDLASYEARCPSCMRVCSTRRIVSRPIIPTIWPLEITGI